MPRALGHGAPSAPWAAASGRPLNFTVRPLGGCQVKRSLLLGILAAATLCACQSSLPRPTAPPAVPLGTYSGGDGTSATNAVIIDAKSDLSATRTEYAWLREHVPGAKGSRQSLVHDASHTYDLIEVILPDGTKRSYFFDITRTYGKL